MMRTAIENALENAWKEVKEAYDNEKINSERALQAVIYKSLTWNLDSKQFTVLIEPTWAEPISTPDRSSGLVPDMVIVNKRKGCEEVLCVLELKCAPHWWIDRPNTLRDLQKLNQYRTTTTVRLDIFGPERKFDPNKKKWIPEQPAFKVTNDVALVFVGMAISNGNLEKQSFTEEPTLADLLLHPHFHFVWGKVNDATGDLTIDVE